MPAYFERIDAHRFRATSATQGAWNTEQQHIAPALGLLTHVVEHDRDARRDDGLLLSRLSFDILGTMPLGDVEVAVRVIRPGRTIELVEATLAHDRRAAVILRAWLMDAGSTASIAGSALPPMPPPDAFGAEAPADAWPGEFVRTLDLRREEHEPGRARFWLRLQHPLIEGEPSSLLARALGVADVANGMTPRVAPRHAVFPNVDTTVHLFTQPRSAWIGFDTTVSFGAEGIGLTHTVMHDEQGPIGSIEQILTVRPV